VTQTEFGAAIDRQISVMSTSGAPLSGLLTQHKSRADFIEEQLKEEAACSFKPLVRGYA
jgi:hypothetical protein